MRESLIWTTRSYCSFKEHKCYRNSLFSSLSFEIRFTPQKVDSVRFATSCCNCGCDLMLSIFRFLNPREAVSRGSHINFLGVIGQSIADRHYSDWNFSRVVRPCLLPVFERICFLNSTVRIWVVKDSISFPSRSTSSVSRILEALNVTVPCCPYLQAAMEII